MRIDFRPKREHELRLRYGKTRRRLAQTYKVGEFGEAVHVTRVGAQRRLQGRLLVEPVVDLDDYACKAVIDWVEIGFRIERSAPTQSTAINGWLADATGVSHWVGGPAREETYTGRDFIVRVQDPEKSMIDAILKHIENRLGLEGGPELRGLEVSVDFYPVSGSEDDRQRMTGLLQRHFLPHRSVAHALVKEDRKPEDDGTPNAAPRSTIGTSQHLTWDVVWRDTDSQPYIDGTYYVGPKEGDELWRIQDKITNRRHKGTFTLLPPDQRRARIEVCLKDAALRERGFNDLGSIRFEHLSSDAFSFKLATVPGGRGAASDLNRWFLLRRFEKGGVYAVHYQEHRWRKITTHNGYGTLVTWSKLQKKVRKALERLSCRWGAKSAIAPRRL